MAKEMKKAYLANFNITFGLQHEPLLIHLKDIVVPALQDSTIYRKVQENRYQISDCSIKKYGNEYILVGMLIKDAVIQAKSERDKNNELIEVNKKLKHSPYSMFLVFLRNHRMILVKNQPESPDVKSFNATIRYVINTYRRNENRKISIHNNNLKSDANILDPLPEAFVDIINIPYKGAIQDNLIDVEKITKLTIKNFTPNGNISFDNIFDHLIKEKDDLGSKKVITEFLSPKNIEAVGILADNMHDSAYVRVDYVSTDGVKQTLDNNKIGANFDIPLDHENEDKYSEIINIIGDREEFEYNDPENLKLYQKSKNELDLLTKENKK
ncbi:hypothetical protein LJC08_05630 [Methanimicrococcus sp. OttesenSCG-928-J09]|nr:hypothetical protein [Methanimicrococcus sp. OttesenSCG-928-J09]